MAEKAVTLGPLPRYWTLGKAERFNLSMAMKRPLSGYLGGFPSTGYFINQLIDEWRATFDVHYVIPCNSATSGLMAACMAAGVGPGDQVWVSTYTMSATATCAMVLGAEVTFLDVDRIFYTLDPLKLPTGMPPKAIIVTNLFGVGAHLEWLRNYCDTQKIVLIEDNAQAPFATCNGRFTGTIGHMGVFSLNVHKHLQCGEGGVVVTNRADLAVYLEEAINHGELDTNFPGRIVGGNFRMTEPIAAIASAQLKKGPDLVRGRIDLAEAISAIFNEVSFVSAPVKRLDDIHVYYLWAGKVAGSVSREAFIQRLRNRGVPFRAGYSRLLHRLFGATYRLPIAEELEDQRLITFEICAYDLKAHHLQRMREIILQEANAVEQTLKAA